MGDQGGAVRLHGGKGIGSGADTLQPRPCRQVHVAQKSGVYQGPVGFEAQGSVVRRGDLHDAGPACHIALALAAPAHGLYSAVRHQSHAVISPRRHGLYALPAGDLTLSVAVVAAGKHRAVGLQTQGVEKAQSQDVPGQSRPRLCQRGPVLRLLGRHALYRVDGVLRVCQTADAHGVLLHQRFRAGIIPQRGEQHHRVHPPALLHPLDGQVKAALVPALRRVVEAGDLSEKRRRLFKTAGTGQRLRLKIDAASGKLRRVLGISQGIEKSGGIRILPLLHQLPGGEVVALLHIVQRQLPIGKPQGNAAGPGGLALGQGGFDPLHPPFRQTPAHIHPGAEQQGKDEGRGKQGQNYRPAEGGFFFLSHRSALLSIPCADSSPCTAAWWSCQWACRCSRSYRCRPHRIRRCSPPHWPRPERRRIFPAGSRWR